MTADSSAVLAGDAARPLLSLCMIVKNEAHFLARCLGAVRDHVDEIIVVDTGSTDETRAIAGRFTDTIYDFTWVDDFAAARNFSLEQASGDWILVLDADELVAEDDLVYLRQLIQETREDAFFLLQYNYSNNSLEPDWVRVEEQTPYNLGFKGYHSNPIARLFRNGRGIRYHGRIHEVIDPSLDGLDFSTLQIPLHHHIDGDPTKPRRDRSLNYLRLIEQELASQPDGRLYATAASVYMYHLQDYARAGEYFRSAAELGYQPDRSLEGAAEACYRLEDLQNAYQLYLQLYESGYTSVSLCSNLANLMVRSQQYPRAVELLRRCLSLEGVDPESVARIEQNIRFLEGKIARSGDA